MRIDWDDPEWGGRKHVSEFGDIGSEEPGEDGAES